MLPKPFIIETNNTQVVGFIKNNTGLSYYKFKIVSIKGSDNYLAKQKCLICRIIFIT